MRYTIENEKIICKIDSLGAELKSLKKKADGREVMWGADPAFWNRTSPVLFPFVGGLRNKRYRYEGKEYSMSQHGFARDMEFTAESVKSDEIWFSLSDSAESLEKYPFKFLLKIGYRLEGAAVKVLWEVENRNEGTMFFAIGAHPGFYVPSLKGHSFLLYDKKGNAVSSVKNRIFGKNGGVTDETEVIATPEGKLNITEALFDNDALIIEKDQLGRVELVDADNKRVASVEFAAPLVGLWSPPGKNAPFICIEPWYGRCDSETFEGELPEREYEQKLDAGKTFKAEYSITV